VAREAVARGSAPKEKSPLRVVRRGPAPVEEPSKPVRVRRPAKAVARKSGAVEVTRTPAHPRHAKDQVRLQDAILRAARALDRGYERDAVRILRPMRDLHPEAPDVRELLGLALYRLGRWILAQKELEAFVNLTGSTEQHPVLMDIARALRRHARVEELWEELRAASPSPEVMTEGRIVAAGSLADRGQVPQAIKLLERGPVSPKRVGEHHLRLWYALADLQERAGDLPTARSLFRKVSSKDPAFVDVAERLAALS
jgi:tetratricopeptide (TPR) repeat protein